MHSLIYLKAAYAAAWLGYLGYLGHILARMKKVAAEREELERTFASGKTATLTRSAS
jgi:hypothetical protein